MGQNTWRGWQSLAHRLVVPNLGTPTHWDETGTEWEVATYGVMGAPVQWLAQGVQRIASRWGGGFMAHAIVVPLFIPQDGMGTAYFQRLSSAHTGWDFENPTPDTREDIARDLTSAINDQGLPYLESAGTLTGFLHRALERQRSVLDQTGALAYGEDVGYASLLLGDLQTAEQQLSEFARPDDDDRDWERASRERCAHVVRLLRAAPEQARAQLATWAAQRSGVLKLATLEGSR